MHALAALCNLVSDVLRFALRPIDLALALHPLVASRLAGCLFNKPLALSVVPAITAISFRVAFARMS